MGPGLVCDAFDVGGFDGILMRLAVIPAADV